MNTQSLTHKYHSHHKQNTQCLEAFELGSRYLATKDVARAIRWYERAAAAGHAVAQYNLGLMYLKGEGVSRDAFKGLGYIANATDLGDARARKLLQRIDQALVG